MKFSVASLALFVAGSLAQFTINTPSNVVECQPTLLTWSGGLAPYYLSVLPGAAPNGNALENLGEQNSTSLTWVCNIASGTSIGLTLRDSSGLIAQTAPFNVNAGCSNFGVASTSCTNTTSVSPGPTSLTSAAAPSSTSATSGISTPIPATSGTPATTGTTTTPGSTHTSSAGSGTTGASSSTSSSAASANVIRVGAAGIAGVAVAALFF
ncbi:hypothetical protein BDR07DRAFT_1372543 [Suillus spraguei]|nr:hypothetical protein BDR07DRAFT_1372543 [Suillus spraguei]